MNSFALSIVLVFAMAASASAGVAEFSKFTIDVPEGWTAKEENKTISLLAPGNAAAISIVWDDSDGIPAEELAQRMSSELKGTKPVSEEGGYAFTFKSKSGVDSKSVLFADDKQFIVLTVTGHHNQLAGVLQSMKAK